MTIDETIAKEKANAEKLRKIIETGYDGGISIESIFCDDTAAIKEAYERFENCAKEYEQVAEWLEELKSYRASVFSGDMTQAMLKERYCKAIDDLVKEFKRKTPMENCLIDEIAEQLKAGEQND